VALNGGKINPRPRGLWLRNSASRDGGPIQRTPLQSFDVDRLRGGTIFFRASSVRVCHPGPVALKCRTTSGDKRSESAIDDGLPAVPGRCQDGTRTVNPFFSPTHFAEEPFLILSRAAHNPASPMPSRIKVDGSGTCSSGSAVPVICT